MASKHIMPSGSRKPKGHDFATLARSVVERTIGEKLGYSPLDDPNAGKNPATAALGRPGAAPRQSGLGSGTVTKEAETDRQEGGGAWGKKGR